MYLVLTGNNGQDNEDDDDEYEPQFPGLPPQLALQTSGCALEHVRIP